jgi:hypothetical protein
MILAVFPLRQAIPPGAVFRAIGAGTARVNGWYKPFGTHNGKPDYWKVGGSGTSRSAQCSHTVAQERMESVRVRA